MGALQRKLEEEDAKRRDVEARRLEEEAKKREQAPVVAEDRPKTDVGTNTTDTAAQGENDSHIPAPGKWDNKDSQPLMLRSEWHCDGCTFKDCHSRPCEYRQLPGKDYLHEPNKRCHICQLPASLLEFILSCWHGEIEDSSSPRQRRSITLSRTCRKMFDHVLAFYQYETWWQFVKELSPRVEITHLDPIPAEVFDAIAQRKINSYQGMDEAEQEELTVSVKVAQSMSKYAGTRCQPERNGVFRRACAGLIGQQGAGGLTLDSAEQRIYTWTAIYVEDGVTAQHAHVCKA